MKGKEGMSWKEGASNEASETGKKGGGEEVSKTQGGEE